MSWPIPTGVMFIMVEPLEGYHTKAIVTSSHALCGNGSIYSRDDER